MKLQGKKINFLGDSITHGSGTTSEDKIFTSLIKERYNLAASRNYGIDGSRIAYQYENGVAVPGNSFVKRVDDMDEDADIIVIFGGTNDFGHGNAPFGTFDDRTPDTFCGASHVLMTKLLNRYPGKPIVFLTPLHRGNEDSPRGDHKPEDVATLAEYVEVIRRTAAYYALPVLDLYKMSGIQPRVPVIRERLCPDALHPNDAGHNLLADRIGAFLESL